MPFRKNLSHMPTNGRKPCSGCKEIKVVGEFNRDRTGPGGFNYECRVCTSARGRASHYRNLGKAHARSRAWKNNNPTKVAEAYFRYYYGISVADYNQMLQRQGGGCAICGRPESMTFRKVIRRMCVDHDHDTGKVRGLLCGLCNTGIGALKHQAALLESAIEYLRKGNDAAS